MSVGRRDDERRIEPVFGPVAFIKTGFLFALYRCGCCSLCVRAFVCVLISPVLMERGKKRDSITISEDSDGRALLFDAYSFVSAAQNICIRTH